MHRPEWSLFILYWLWSYHYFILMNWQYILAFDPYKWWLLKSGVKPGGELWHGLSFQVRTGVQRASGFSINGYWSMLTSQFAQALSTVSTVTTVLYSFPLGTPSL